ncbi:nucleotide-diphospho-sugar transferase, partial [Mollisia scopiformis]
YFTSTRMLNYQLQHCKSTRSKTEIPFLVLTPLDVPQYQVDQLAEEGATIIPISLIKVPSWIKPGAHRWQNVMSKLRLFELTEYSRILFLDADTFILKPMDGIFSDPASFPLNTSQQVIQEDNEAPLPPTYLFASLPEVLHTMHPYPPHAWRNFNAGFFLFSPSLALFNYYLSLLNITNRFDPTYPEQNLLNYAHREFGNMPWRRLGGRHGEWNINLPNMNDVRKGVRSVHAKLW